MTACESKSSMMKIKCLRELWNVCKNVDIGHWPTSNSLVTMTPNNLLWYSTTPKKLLDWSNIKTCSLLTCCMLGLVVLYLTKVAWFDFYKFINSYIKVFQLQFIFRLIFFSLALKWSQMNNVHVHTKSSNVGVA